MVPNFTAYHTYFYLYTLIYTLELKMHVIERGFAGFKKRNFILHIIIEPKFRPSKCQIELSISGPITPIKRYFGEISKYYNPYI